MPPIFYLDLVIGQRYRGKVNSPFVNSEEVRDYKFLGLVHLHGQTYLKVLSNTGIDYRLPSSLILYSPNDPEVAPIPIVWGPPDLANDLEEVGPPEPQIYHPPPLQKLNIGLAPHIGILREGDDLILNGNTNSINGENFENDDECVRIRADNGPIKMPPDSNNGYFVWKTGPDSIQGWFNILIRGENFYPVRPNNYKRTNPNTRQTILQGEMERFTYRKPPAGGRRRKTRRKINKRKKLSKRRK